MEMAMDDNDVAREKTRPADLDATTEFKLRGLRHMVGNSPILAIECTFLDKRRTIYAKAENLNMTGSIKDRMVLHIVHQGYVRGLLEPGAPIVEATSGNTGISIAGIGRAMGHPVTIFMPDWMSRERIDLIRSLGAEIQLVSKEQGGFLGAIELAESLANQTPGAFLPRQFSNQDNVAAHALTTGPEIWWQLRYNSLRPDAFVAGVGTGGTIMGAGRFLREMQPAVKIHPLEPENSPTLTTGRCVGKHRIQGISDEFIPPIVNMKFLDEVVSIDDGDAIRMSQKLASRLGIGVGISSGANFLGALKLVERYGDDTVVVTVFPDDNKKYLSTDLLHDEPLKEGFLSTRVDLLGFGAFKRVCHTCCDPSDCVQLRVLEGSHDDPDLPPCPLWKVPEYPAG
jgi:cysteine synthase A